MKINNLLLAGCLLLPIQFATAEDTNSAAGSPAGADGSGFSGKVIDTTNAASYTYVQVDTGSKKVWAATTEFPVKVGDQVKVGKGSFMGNWHSKSLGRDFDDIYFAESIAVGTSDAGGMPALPPGHPAIGGASAPGLPPGHPLLTTPAGAGGTVDLSGIKKA